jgi:nicotinamide riboside kinase
MEKRIKNLNLIKKIAAIGPESTGKTSLAEKLAEYYQTIWVPEYGRQYVEDLKRPYYYEDVEIIAKEQVQREENFLKEATNYIFFDTELIIIKIWFIEVFQELPNWIDDAIKSSNIDLYLLCYPDLEWEFDPVRENPNRRFYLYNLYKDELDKINANYKIVKGFGDQRINSSIEIINTL